MVAPLAGARPGRPLPGVAFSREAVANAFVMLGLLAEERAEEILAERRPGLQAKGFRMGVLTGELSVRPGAHGYQEAQAMARGDLTGIPLAVAADQVPIATADLDLSLTRVTVTPGGVTLRFQASTRDHDPSVRPLERPIWVVPRQDLSGAIRAGLSVTDDRGRRYELWPLSGHGTTAGPGQPVTWDGEMRAEPVAGPQDGGATTSPVVRWLDFTVASSRAVRVVMPRPAEVETGPAEPPWPTPAECYLAALAEVTSMTIGTGGETVELDTAQITAAVAEALLWVGALPSASPLLHDRSAAPGWQRALADQWGQRAYLRARDAGPDRAGLAVALPLRQATAVIETITAHQEFVSIELYGHPWVSGEYWPMITPCFQVRAVDDTGAGHEGVRGSGGGAPEASYEFWFWPPVAPEAKRIRVIVSTLREAAWAEIDIPGR
jgi:hypothetical protein